MSRCSAPASTKLQTHAVFLFSTAEHVLYLMTSSGVNQTERVSLWSVIWFYSYSDQT